VASITGRWEPKRLRRLTVTDRRTVLHLKRACALLHGAPPNSIDA
jgi:hypothetical protein